MVEKQLTPQQKWNQKNKEKLRLAAAKWRDTNKEKARLTCREWKKANPAKHTALQMKRKAAKLQRTPAWANLIAIEEFYHRAALRSQLERVPYQVDHIVPLQGEFVSGLHVENNLQVITAAENAAKGNRYICG